MSNELMMSTRYRVIPDAVLFAPDLSAGAKVLYGVLASFAGGSDDSTAWPGLEGVRKRICDQAAKLGDPNYAGPSVATLKRQLAELESAGWVARRRRRNTSSVTFVAAFRGELPPWDQPQMIPPEIQNSSDLSSPNSSDLSSPNSSDLSCKRKEGKEPKGKEPAAPTEIEAQTIARQVFDQRPNNAHTFMALRSVAQRLLAAGHPPPAITAAMIAAPTVTIPAVEMQLSRQPRKRAKLIDQTAQTGEVRD